MPRGDSSVKRAVGGGAKEWISFAPLCRCGSCGVRLAIISIAIYVGVSIVWLVPDRRFVPKRRLVTPSRLTSFTDGVIAVIITIMVLELPVPKAPGHGRASSRSRCCSSPTPCPS